MKFTYFCVATAVAGVVGMGLLLKPWKDGKQELSARPSKAISAEQGRAAPTIEATPLIPAFVAPHTTRVHSSPVVEPVREPDVQPSREPPSAQDHEAYVDSIFSQEVSDPAWSRSGERTVTEMLRPVTGNSVLESIECRSSLCRVKARHPTEADFQGFIDGLVNATRGAWRGALISVRDPSTDGVIRNTVFLSKEGHEVPRLE
jgi:hypothetical protein